MQNTCSASAGAESIICLMPATPAETTDSATVVVEGPRAFYSYSHLDWKSSVRLVEELKLRGFHVFRDVERMREGQRLEDEMGVGIEEAHLLMCLLTEKSLASPPVVEKELKPALRKFVREGLPVVMPVVSGLGATHQEVYRRTWPVLQHDFAATWSGGVLPNATTRCRSTTRRRWPPRPSPPCTPVGTAQPTASGSCSSPPAAPPRLGTGCQSMRPRSGGGHAQVGHPAAWERVHRGLLDLERALRAHGARREVELQVVPISPWR